MGNILAFDPGATRAGWGVIEYEYPGGVRYVDSGVIAHPRGEQTFQEYRMTLINEWVDHTVELIDKFEPCVVVTEIVPSRGAGIPEQLYLANTMVAAVHATCYYHGKPMRQVAARSVQAEIGLRGKSKAVTKPQVRNGVLQIFPQLEPRRKDFAKVFEETDALAIALYFVHHPGG